MTSSFKKYSLGALIVVLGIFLLSYMTTEEKPRADTLIVGLQSGYPPFEFMDAGGNIVGFDVDLANLIATKMNKSLEIKDMEFEGEILSLKQGKIDLIMSGMNITPSRLKEIDMVPYHGEAVTSFNLVFWKEIPEGVKSLQDIANLPEGTVSVESGSIPESFLSLYPEITAKSFQGSLAPLMDVKFGKSTANLVQEDVALYLKSKHPEIQIIDVPVPADQKILGFGIGIKKGNTELYNQIKEIILELKKSGELKTLQDKWFKGGPE